MEELACASRSVSCPVHRWRVRRAHGHRHRPARKARGASRSRAGARRGRGAAGAHPTGEGERRRGAEIELECTLDEAQVESVHEAAYLRLGESPAKVPDWDVGIEDVLAMPYYHGAQRGAYPGEFDSHVTTYYDRVPKGEVEVRRASAVISADGHSLGDVDGFVVDADKHITHFVLERGHLGDGRRSRSRSGPSPGSERRGARRAVQGRGRRPPRRSRRPTRLTRPPRFIPVATEGQMNGASVRSRRAAPHANSTRLPQARL